VALPRIIRSPARNTPPKRRIRASARSITYGLDRRWIRRSALSEAPRKGIPMRTAPSGVDTSPVPMSPPLCRGMLPSCAFVGGGKGNHRHPPEILMLMNRPKDPRINNLSDPRAVRAGHEGVTAQTILAQALHELPFASHCPER
jgi:hypothetical protein